MKRVEKNTFFLSTEEYRGLVPELVLGNLDSFEELREKRTMNGVVHQCAYRRHGSLKQVPLILIVR